MTILRCKVPPKLLTQQHRRVVKLVLRQFKQTLFVAGDMDRLHCLSWGMKSVQVCNVICIGCIAGELERLGSPKNSLA